MDKLILVTGSTGYIASRLIPRLLDSGYRVRCLAREPRRLQGRSWFRYVEVVQGDVTTPSTLPQALQGVHTAYYLVHNMSQGHGYTALELDSARLFTSAAEQAGIEHIIYLGGLADPEQDIAPHMRSRIETGQILRQGNVPVTEFRAGVIVGSGSISFEMIRFMTELFPVVPGPVWMKNKAQPIAIQNVVDYLLAALINPNGRGGVFEIGGPDILAYGELMLGYARIRGLKRKMILLPKIPLWFMALGVDWMTPVPYPIAYALIDGLSADSVVKYPEALEIFPEVRLIDFETATKEALEKTHPTRIERMWETGKDFGSVAVAPWRHLPQRAVDSDDSLETSEVWITLKHEGSFVDHREVTVEAEPEKVFGMILNLCEKRSWIIEVNEANQQALASLPGQIAGRQWIEWRVRHAGSVTYVSQTVFFSPRGLPGFLYWYLLYPFHLINFRGLIKSIARQSQIQ
jgi:uncharacterized protein YbjT (DUF2867 family)